MTQREKNYQEKVLIPVPEGIKDRLREMGKLSGSGASMTQIARQCLLNGIEQAENALLDNPIAK